MEIINLKEQHYKDVSRIYLEGIATQNATFEKTAPDWETWNKGHLEFCRYVAIEGNEIVGWAALSAVSGRCVYAGVAEVSEYIAGQHRGKGVGRQLLQKIITDSESNGIWTLQAGIFPENEASIKLHEQCGFRMVGYREKIGQMNGVWRNTVLLERRSTIAGL
ncbi:N-acetyltransferase family protein [Taibaiella lutea]|uniref:N-acetyltransferase family protein n=1 Tax=Taibaiella lutea TaxID=2608001 RepID=A0A5M6CPM5_9BACT|nr:GNAT family N-acetyltransferase [Taibaiella lutea]KAA5536903.1 N-acetyltransferase family protein [Taibaiella lutea]